MKHSVTAVVPVYNSAGLLRDAVASIRSQGWPGLRIVVVDDGSKDDTAGVAGELASDDLAVLRQSNAGPAAARNAGIALAQTDWIAFLDADDLWLPQKLQIQFEALQKSPGAAFAYGDALHRYPSGQELRQRPRAAPRRLFLDLLLGPEFFTSSVIVRRSCFEEIGGFDPELRTGEDWDMWLRLSDRYESTYVPEPLIVYRVSEGIRYSSDLLERCTLRVLDRLFARTETRRRWPALASSRGRIYAWHYSVLAKSHLRQKRIVSFGRLAFAAICADYHGAHFLARRWRATAGRPRLVESDAAAPAAGPPRFRGTSKIL